MKAIIIGRHELSGQEGLEVVSQENINFPATSGECRLILFELLQKAKAERAALIFQMMPGQLAVACAGIVDEDVDYQIGVIVNKPGERPAGVIREFHFPGGLEIEEALKFANPRLGIEKSISQFGLNYRIKVDPPLRFEFSHIEFFK